MTALARAIGAIVWVGAMVGCNGSPAGGSPDGGSPAEHRLSLRFTLAAPSVDKLEIISGDLQLGRVSVFGDVAADSRTMVSRLALGLPEDEHELSFPDAPYGLYSRVQTGPLELHVKGRWRETPFEIEVESDDLNVDLRGPALDYTPEQDARFSIRIDSSAWFDAEALDAATVTLGRIRVDGEDNAALASSIGARMRTSFSLGPTAL